MRYHVYVITALPKYGNYSLAVCSQYKQHGINSIHF